MTKLIFFIFLFVCSLQSFSQKIYTSAKFYKQTTENKVVIKNIQFEMEFENNFIIENKKEIVVEKLPAKVFVVEVCNFFNAEMLKKFTAQV